MPAGPDRLTIWGESMTDGAWSDLVVALAGASDASGSAVQGIAGDKGWSEAAVSSLTQVMQTLCLDHWIEGPLRLADFVA